MQLRTSLAPSQDLPECGFCSGVEICGLTCTCSNWKEGRKEDGDLLLHQPIRVEGGCFDKPKFLALLKAGDSQQSNSSVMLSWHALDVAHTCANVHERE